MTALSIEITLARQSDQQRLDAALNAWAELILAALELEPIPLEPPREQPAEIAVC